MFVKLWVFCCLGTIAEIAVNINSHFPNININYLPIDGPCERHTIKEQLASVAATPTTLYDHDDTAIAESYYSNGWYHEIEFGHVCECIHTFDRICVCMRNLKIIHIFSRL